jgi:WD40 repeat protein
VTTGKTIATLTGFTEPVIGIAFSPNGKTFASGGYDNNVQLWAIPPARSSRP